MRIIMLHYAAPPVVGGVERVICSHATLLAERGHDVWVVAGRGEDFAPGVTFHRLELIDSRHPEVLAVKQALDAGTVPDAFSDLVGHIYKRLWTIVKEGDVIIAHNIVSLHKNLALTAALRRLTEDEGRARLIAWHHDLAWKADRYKNEIHAGYPWDLMRQPWPKAIHVAVSEARRADVAEVFGIAPESIAVVPGGVDSTAFLRLSPALVSLSDRLCLSHSWPRLLLPARITRRKNIECALRVVAALRAGPLPEAALVVTGPPGPHNPDNQAYFQELLALRDSLGLQDSAHFLAEELPAPPDETLMRQLYQMADALLLPSLEEGFGLPLLEAGLLRLPVFCSDIPALRELGEGAAHFFAPDADPRYVASLIAETLSADRLVMARQRVFTRYDWRRIVQDYVEPLLEK